MWTTNPIVEGRSKRSDLNLVNRTFLTIKVNKLVFVSCLPLSLYLALENRVEPKNHLYIKGVETTRLRRPCIDAIKAIYSTQKVTLSGI